MKLTVATICRNEAVDAPHFLRSFEGLADEIVVVDDGSSDGSQDILRSHPKVILIESPRGPGEGYAHQRNKALASARGDWLLQVDMDMRLGMGLADEIQRAIAGGTHDAYRFKLEQYFLNRRVRYGGWQFWNDPWLVRQQLCTWTGIVHERCEIRSDRIGQLRSRMIHLTDSCFQERLEKNLHYSLFEVRKLREAGVRVGFVDMLFWPFWRSIRSYILFQGFRDGGIGFVWALYQFTGNMTRLYLRWDEQGRVSREALEQSIYSAGIAGRTGS